MEAKNNNLWVFIETNQDGTAKNCGLELLGPGRNLAEKQGGELVGVVIGYKVDEAVKAATAYGADQVIVVDGKEFAHYTTDAYTNAFYTLVEKYGPTSILIGATNNGRDMGPRLSCRLKTGLTADCASSILMRRVATWHGLDLRLEAILWPPFLCPNNRPQIVPFVPAF